MTQYGFAEPGIGGVVTNENPLANMFARFDLINLPASSRIVARYNYVNGQQDILSRSPTVLSLSNNGYNFQSVTNSYLAQLFSGFNNGSNNEFLIGLTKIRDKRITPLSAPFVRISRMQNEINSGTGSVTAGTENSSQGNELDQDIFELTDNYTLPVSNHRFTIGTKNEFFKVRNLFAQNSLGNFTFGTLDSLIANRPSAATLGIRLPDGTDGAARFNARTLGFYVEDEWQATSTLSTTFGIRLDMPGLTSNPGQNPDVLTTLGINTTDVPRNVKQWSPRFGFNWDVTGDQRNQLRGGSGVFVGRPAYVWLSNLFGNSGVNGYGNLVCNGLNAPIMPNAGTLPAQGARIRHSLPTSQRIPSIRISNSHRCGGARSAMIAFSLECDWDVRSTLYSLRCQLLLPEHRAGRRSDRHGPQRSLAVWRHSIRCR